MLRTLEDALTKKRQNSKALVTRSDALVSTSVLVTTSKALVTTSDELVTRVNTIGGKKSKPSQTQGEPY